ncbi:hypothetical protein Ddye_021759 [Dipteronia dyeriana]|uniref:DUF8040 domain-containing protein n=1 Tax=Dipteronia dyeriana TaxID=168575 RepID=A0AAD9U398_9ROSI|nr:hypothetical protein Ddye_021759 [Dipteronia dyeriana]
MSCDLLKSSSGLLNDGNVTTEEQVATFVNILAHHTKNRSVQLRFYRYGETFSRYVHQVLRALLRLENALFVKPALVLDDCTDSRWRWFKFIYVLSGWYGSSTDSRVLQDAITRHNGLKIPFVFGKDRATSNMAESPAVALDNMRLETEESDTAGFT